MEKTEYQTAVENEKAAIQEMVKERDLRLVRFAVRETLKQLEDAGALVVAEWADEDEEIPKEAYEAICEKFWKLDM